MAITSFQGLKDYCLRRLGAPVLNIEVANEQVQDCLDAALQLFVQRHYDGTEERLIRICFTSADETRQYIRIPSEVVAILEIFDLSLLGSGSSAEEFERIKFLISQTDLVDFAGTAPREYDLLSYDLTMQYISMLQMYFTNQRSFNFNKATGHLYVPSGRIAAGNYLLIRCYAAVDPERSTNVYDDEWVKRYATQLIKKDWGTNLKKYEGVKMAGEVTVNGQKIYDEAVAELAALEVEFEARYRLPYMPTWG